MFDLDRLLATARAGPLAASPVHGERHWKAVAALGLDLCDVTAGADRAVVFLFALLHDCRRENEHDDAGHGRRAARLVDELAGNAIALEPARVQLLERACRDHTATQRSSERTLAVCFDADRLNLWRCGIAPATRFLSTAAARDPHRIEQGRLYPLYAATKTWQQLAKRATR